MFILICMFIDLDKDIDSTVHKDMLTLLAKSGAKFYETFVHEKTRN